MSLLFKKTVEERGLSFQSVWGSGGDASLLSGDNLSAALSVVPVYAATGLIADQVAAAPWAAYEKTADLATRLKSQPQLVTDPGVNELDLFSWKHQMVTSMLLRGTAFGYILSIDSAGVPSKVLWLRPDLMEVDESGPVPLFYYSGERIDRSSLVVIPMYVVPGSILGRSPLQLFRSQIETGIEAQRVGKNFFKRGAQPPAILKNMTKVLNRAEALAARSSFVASTSASEPFVTGMDWSYEAIGLPSSDVAFLSTIKATATQIAAIYRVSPEQIGGETSSSLTYKNLEQDQIKFNTITLRPITSRIESVFGRHLPEQQYIRSNLDASARSDLKTRYDAHAVAITNGFKTPDEVRLLEEMPPLTPEQMAQIAAMRTSAAPTPAPQLNA